MDEVFEFLQKTHTYYLATVEGDQPRVRPFGVSYIYEGKLYIQTGKKKAVSHQIQENPKVEICAFDGSTWLRLAGELVRDDRVEVKQAVLDANPGLKRMYSAEDDNTEVLYFKHAVATFSSFAAEPKTIEW